MGWVGGNGKNPAKRSPEQRTTLRNCSVKRRKSNVGGKIKTEVPGGPQQSPLLVNTGECNRPQEACNATLVFFFFPGGRNQRKPPLTETKGRCGESGPRQAKKTWVTREVKSRLRCNTRGNSAAHPEKNFFGKRGKGEKEDKPPFSPCPAERGRWPNPPGPEKIPKDSCRDSNAKSEND